MVWANGPTSIKDILGASRAPKAPGSPPNPQRAKTKKSNLEGALVPRHFPLDSGAGGLGGWPSGSSPHGRQTHQSYESWIR